MRASIFMMIFFGVPTAPNDQLSLAGTMMSTAKAEHKAPTDVGSSV